MTTLMITTRDSKGNINYGFNQSDESYPFLAQVSQGLVTIPIPTGMNEMMVNVTNGGCIYISPDATIVTPSAATIQQSKQFAVDRTVYINLQDSGYLDDIGNENVYVLAISDGNYEIMFYSGQ